MTYQLSKAYEYHFCSTESLCRTLMYDCIVFCQIYLHNNNRSNHRGKIIIKRYVISMFFRKRRKRNPQQLKKVRLKRQRPTAVAAVMTRMKQCWENQVITYFSNLFFDLLRTFSTFYSMGNLLSFNCQFFWYIKYSYH